MRATCAPRSFGARAESEDETAREIGECRRRQVACAEGREDLGHAFADEAWEVRIEAARVAADVTSEQFCFDAPRDPCTAAVLTSTTSVCSMFSWVIPALVRAIHDPNWQVGVAALEALGNAQPPRPEIAIVLRAALERPEADDAGGARMIAAAADALGRYGALGAPATAALAKRTDAGERSSVRISALRALTAMGRGAYGATPKLIALVSDSDWSVRMNVAIALGAIAPLVPESRRALEVLARDPESLVAAEATSALRARR